MRMIARIAAIMLLAALAAGCKQEVISETYTPYGPSLRPSSNPAEGRTIGGMQPAQPVRPAGGSDSDAWDWLTDLFDAEDRPAQPAQPTAASPSMAMPMPMPTPAPQAQ